MVQKCTTPADGSKDRCGHWVLVNLWLNTPILSVCFKSTSKIGSEIMTAPIDI